MIFPAQYLQAPPSEAATAADAAMAALLAEEAAAAKKAAKKEAKKKKRAGNATKVQDLVRTEPLTDRRTPEFLTCD